MASMRGDEVALRWAALERLPTCDRVRRAIFPPLGGDGPESQVVDVVGLGPGTAERCALLERLVRVAYEDNERFLLKLKDRVERVEIDMPTSRCGSSTSKAEAKVRVGTTGRAEEEQWTSRGGAHAAATYRGATAGRRRGGDG